MSPATATNRSVLMIEAVAAARLGQKGLARRLFNEIVEKDPHAEHALLWLAALADTPDESIRSLEQVLLINPGNEQAIKALEVQRAHQIVGPTEVPLPPPAVRALAAGPFHRPNLPARKPLQENGQTALSVTKPEEAPVPVRAPAQFQKAIRRVYHCPICRAEHLTAPPRCSHCGCYLEIENLQKVAENGAADEVALSKAIEDWRQRLNSDPFEANLNIARALLGLNRSAEALINLHAAVTLEPGQSGLRNAVSNLESRKLVVAVEKSASIRKLLALQLDREGYRVLTVEDGLNALSQMEKFKPDLVLLDTGLPKLDGFEICRVLRKHEDLQQVPVVLLSTAGGLAARLKSRFAGANDLLVKPIALPALMNVVSKYAQSGKT